MRALFLLLGVWHGLISLWAVLFGLWLTVMGIIAGGPGLFGLILLLSGIASLPALGLVAQGGKGMRNAGAVLILPFAAMGLWVLTWSGPSYGGWLYAMFLLPGAVLGALALFSEE